MDAIWDEFRAEVFKKNKDPLDHVELTKLPKNLNGKTITSMIVSASKVVPLKVDVVLAITEDIHRDGQQAAVVQFRTEGEAFKAVKKLKATPYARTWQAKFITNPTR